MHRIFSPIERGRQIVMVEVYAVCVCVYVQLMSKQQQKAIA